MEHTGRLLSRAAVRLARTVRFFGHYVAELARSGIRVAGDVVSPASRARPCSVRLPLEAASDGEIALVAHLVSLTPGTLAVDVEDDLGVLLVHVMFMDEGTEESVVQSLKDAVERPVLQLLR